MQDALFSPCEPEGNSVTIDHVLWQRITVLGAAFAAHPHTQAVALGGSRGTGVADPASDIDLYVYASAEVPVAFRTALIAARSTRSEIDNRIWETGDEWDDRLLGTHVDVMFRSQSWAEEELARVLDRHEAQLGYSTCFWHNIRTSRAVYDRQGWFAALGERARRPYPEPLARAVIGKNLPVLRTSFASFREQVSKAATRGDGVSVNHRVAAFLASYFDVLFAFNRAPHPGEKRLLQAARDLPKVPPGLTVQVERLLAAAPASDALALRGAIDELCDGLEELVGSGNVRPRS